MIKLIDILNEVQLSRYQLFATGTGGRSGGQWEFDGKKLPTGKLKITMPMRCGNKPAGGFWTSSYKQKFKGSDWTRWKKQNMDHWDTGEAFVFKVVGSPKIARVKNYKDYDKLFKKYGAGHYAANCSEGDRYLDWHALAKDYDAFHLASYRGLGPVGIHPNDWSAESVVWFNMKKLEFVGTTAV